MRLDSIVCPTKNQVSCRLEGEEAILNLKAGMYYGLDSVGAFAWQWAKKKVSVRRIRDEILEKYDVSPEDCQKDLFSLLKELERHDLISILNEETD